MSEVFELSVFRREARGTVRLWVGVLIIGEVGLQTLADLYPAEADAESLTRALLQGDERARRETALPKKWRFRDGGEFWRAAGFKGWRAFFNGATSCDIRRSDEDTEVQYWVPNLRNPGGLAPSGYKEIHPADISYEDLARIVLRIFTKFPAERPFPPTPH